MTIEKQTKVEIRHGKLLISSISGKNTDSTKAITRLAVSQPRELLQLLGNGFVSKIFETSNKENHT